MPTKTAPRKKSKQDEAPKELAVNQCPVCHTEGNIRLYVGDNPDTGLVRIRRVWYCECGFEWPREPEHTAK